MINSVLFDTSLKHDSKSSRGMLNVKLSLFNFLSCIKKVLSFMVFNNFLVDIAIISIFDHLFII